MSARAVMRIVGHGTLRTAIPIRLASENTRANALIAVASRCEERRLGKARIPQKGKREKKSRPRAYAYFNFRLDVAGEPLIHPRRNRVVVIWVLDLHDALYCVSLFVEHEGGKETERKKKKKRTTTTKNRSRAALRIHSANDITRPRTSSRCDTLTFPHRDLQDFKDFRRSPARPSNFAVLWKSGRSA